MFSSDSGTLSAFLDGFIHFVANGVTGATWWQVLIVALRAHGFDDEAIWDIGAITAFFSMSNRLVHLTGTPPNEPFYLMGRVPKG